MPPAPISATRVELARVGRRGSLKLVNDGYGHLFGDEVLLLVSRLMKRSFRGADQLFRFGGEEFLVVLERTNELGATIALERLRSAVAEYPFPQIGKVTVSAGFTRIVPTDVATTCVERADEALYHAKKRAATASRTGRRSRLRGKPRTNPVPETFSCSTRPRVTRRSWASFSRPRRADARENR